MLIEIDNGLIDNCCVVGRFDREKACFRNLLLAHQEGNHLILISNKNVSNLDPEFYSPRDRATAKKIFESYSQYASLKTILPIFYKTGIGDQYNDGRVSSGVSEVVMARIEHFEHSASVSDGLRLLTENSTDSEIYCTFAKFWMNINRIKIGFKVTRQGGGGAEIESEFRNNCEADKITLCIVDSDRKYPGGALGGTAGNLGRVSAGALQSILILKRRELENYLVKLINATFITDEDLRNRLIAHQLSLTCNNDWYTFIDYKEGVKCFEIHGPGRSVHEVKYLKSFLTNISTRPKDRCEASAGVCLTKGSCDIYFFGALGEILARNYVNFVNRDWPASKEKFNNCNCLDLSELSSQLVACGIASRVTIT
ncbi:MAG: hypothetical protein IPL96_07605 [Holophagaceae bacterium]|nr:hypothetical protein [Holophagaceae bacterium]